MKREDSRDERLGAALLAAAELSAGERGLAGLAATARRPALDRIERVRALAAVAAVLVIAGGGAFSLAAAAEDRRGQIAAAAFGFAEDLLPERSAWIEEALAGGDADGDVDAFIQSLWNTEGPL